MDSSMVARRSIVGDHECAVQERPVPEVEQRLNQLSGLIDQLDHDLANFTERLERSVCCPAGPPAGSTNCGPKENRSVCAIAGKVAAANERLLQMRDRLGEVVSRLEI
jgi:hypothetical protein